MKKLLITSTDVMMIQFIVPHVIYLKEHGFYVDVACSSAAGYQNENYLNKIQDAIGKDSHVYSVRTERSPYTLGNRKGYSDLCEIIKEGGYEIVWTNEPVMGVMTRLACRKARKNKQLKVLYMAHGYHFFRGAPIINWVVYPIEKILSKYCDAICLINWEDYNFTKKHFAKTPAYHIDGIGLDTQKFSNIEVNVIEKRKELGFSSDDILLLSVGELQYRKNHKVIIEAISRINNPKIKYIICGCGELEAYLMELAQKLHVEKQLFLLGHRYDIAEILKSVDIFVHPSLREGLGIAALEAMSAGLPLVTSNIQGIKDFVIDRQTGYSLCPNDVDGFKNAIQTLIDNPELRQSITKKNVEYVKKYDIAESTKQVYSILEEL